MVAIWADHDRAGAAATIAAAQACQAAGAASVETVPLVGPPDSGCGAADLTPDDVGVFIAGRKPWAGPGPEQAGRVWTFHQMMMANPNRSASFGVTWRTWWTCHRLTGFSQVFWLRPACAC